jgi:hypothetical protein
LEDLEKEEVVSNEKDVICGLKMMMLNIFVNADFELVV